MAKPIIEYSSTLQLSKNLLDILTVAFSKYSSLQYIKDGERELLFLGSILQIRSSTQLLEIQDSISRMNFQIQPLLYGGKSFFDNNDDVNWQDFGSFLFHLPQIQIIINDEQVRLSIYGFSQDDITKTNANFLKIIAYNPSLTTFVLDISQDNNQANQNDWQKAISEILQAIKELRVQKVVLSRSKTYKHTGLVNTAPELLIQLIETNPNSFNFCLKEQGSVFLGSSPELLFRCQSGNVDTMALAGTVSKSISEENQFSLTSTKTLDEHKIVVRGITEQLNQLSSSVSINELEEVDYPNLKHLRTKIQAKLKPEAKIVDLINVMHPTPALGGYPRVEALKILQSVESISRGWFGAPVGYVDAMQNGFMIVAIRSALITDEHVRVYAGAGIVEGSNAQQEWNETETKFKTISNLFLKRNA